MRSNFKQNLAHSRAAYWFAIKSLPDPAKLKNGPLLTNGVEFTKESQINSMLIELGWAFYCRFEGCLEAFIKDNKINLNKNCTLEQWFAQNQIKIPEKYAVGLKDYRMIRNKLHHEDGRTGDDTEIHLYPDDMERFYLLFVWMSKKIASVSQKPTN